MINTTEIPGKCLSLLLPHRWPWNPKILFECHEVCCLQRWTLLWSWGFEKREKVHQLACQIFPLGRNAIDSSYNKVWFLGGDKHPFSFFFSGSNLEFSGYSQISAVFKTVHIAATEYFATLSNSSFFESWIYVSLDITCMKHDTTLLYRQLDEY